MYKEETFAYVRAMWKKRWLVTALPTCLMLVLAIFTFTTGQMQRQEWGWIAACAASIVGGAYFIFMYGVYVRPAALYKQHVNHMLHGRLRETAGVLQDIAVTPCNQDGLDYYALTINVGELCAAEDERLLYYDALLGKPQIQTGTKVSAFSNDRKISQILMI